MHGGRTLDAIIAVNFERDRVSLVPSNILHVLTRSNNRYNASSPMAKLITPLFLIFHLKNYSSRKIIRRTLGRISFYPSLYLSALTMIEKREKLIHLA